MNGYAPNPPAPANGAASLTASLLARKGEATPAVDAEAHAGVDFEFSAMRGGAAPARKLRPPPAKSVAAARAPVAFDNVRVFRPLPANANSRGAPLAAGPSPMFAVVRPLPRPANAAREDGRKASVTFRMPAREFARLCRASRDLEMTCLSIILDAVDSYLDANDVARVSDDALPGEIETLTRRMNAARR